MVSGGGGAKTPAEEPDAVELTNPFTVRDVALAAGHVLEVLRVDEQDLEAARLEDFVNRDPIDARRFHGHTRHGTGHEGKPRLARLDHEAGLHSAFPLVTACGLHSPCREPLGR